MRFLTIVCLCQRTGQLISVNLFDCLVQNRVLRGLKFFARSPPHPLSSNPTRTSIAPHPLNLNPTRTSIAPAPNFLSQTRPCPKTTKNSYRLKTSLTSSKTKPVILLIGNQTKTFPQIWSFVINRVKVVKTTFQSCCDQLCVKRCLIHLEGLLGWIIPHQVQW